MSPGTVNTLAPVDRSTIRTIRLRRASPWVGGAHRPTSRTCIYLLSDLAAYVTGQTLDVDGGPSRGALDEHDLPVFVTNPAIRARFES